MTKRESIGRLDLEGILATIDKSIFLSIEARGRLVKILRAEDGETGDIDLK